MAAGERSLEAGEIADPLGVLGIQAHPDLHDPGIGVAGGIGGQHFPLPHLGTDATDRPRRVP